MLLRCKYVAAIESEYIEINSRSVACQEFLLFLYRCGVPQRFGFVLPVIDGFDVSASKVCDGCEC